MFGIQGDTGKCAEILILPLFIRKLQIVADACCGRVEGYKIKEDHAGKTQKQPFTG